MGASTFGPRRTRRTNWIGFRTLYRREVDRFLKVAAQTVSGPVVTTLIFLAVFAVVMNRRGAPQAVDGLPYLAFLAPGLVTMAMAQNAFANASSSILIAKIQGNIADFLMAPLSPAELVGGFALGSVTRGLLVGATLMGAMALFVPFGFVRPSFAVFHALAGSLMMALTGILGGIWAEKMDHLGSLTNFVVTPLTFLSGTFYSVTDLPAGLALVSIVNPFFYMIDGFRYGVTGHADASPATGLAVIAAVDIVLAALCCRLVARGWRLRT